MSALDAIDAAAEQLTLIEGVLQEAVDHTDRLRQALQALSNAKDELAVATRLTPKETT